MYDKSTRQSQKEVTTNIQSFISVKVDIKHGYVYLCPPARDASSNVIPGQKGNLFLSVVNGTIFSVSGYKGDDGLGYVCFTSGNAYLQHNGKLFYKRIFREFSL